MPTLVAGRQGGAAVTLAAAQAANAVSTSIAQRVIPDRQQLGPTLLRIIAATGTACDYLIEGSNDAAVWTPLPWSNLLGAATAAALVQQSGLFHVTAAGTYWLLIGVDVPWQYLRVTSQNQVGSMVNTYDVWSY